MVLEILNIFVQKGEEGVYTPPTSPIYGGREGLIKKQSLFSYTVFDVMAIFQVRVFLRGNFLGWNALGGSLIGGNFLCESFSWGIFLEPNILSVF